MSFKNNCFDINKLFERKNLNLLMLKVLNSLVLSRFFCENR